MLKRASFPVGLVVALAAAGACSSKDGATIAIISTDAACKVATTELKAGSTTFAVRNDGDDVTEVYVFGEKDRVMGEVENIGPGTSRNFTVNLSAGDYEVACKPGMKGDGIRTPISVTGKGGNVKATATETIEVSATNDEVS